MILTFDLVTSKRRIDWRVFTGDLCVRCTPNWNYRTNMLTSCQWPLAIRRRKFSICVILRGSNIATKSEDGITIRSLWHTYCLSFLKPHDLFVSCWMNFKYRLASTFSVAMVNLRAKVEFFLSSFLDLRAIQDGTDGQTLSNDAPLFDGNITIVPVTRTRHAAGRLSVTSNNSPLYVGLYLLFCLNENLSNWTFILLMFHRRCSVRLRRCRRYQSPSSALVFRVSI